MRREAEQTTVWVLAALLTVVLLLFGHSRAEERMSPPTAQRLTLTVQEAISLFLKQNLDLLITHYGIDSAKGEQITARLFPNPTLNLGAFSSATMAMGLPSRSTELNGTLTQLFEIAGKRGYRIESAHFGTRSAEALFEDTVRQLSFAVKDAYFQVQGTRRHAAIAQDNVDRFRRILEINAIRYDKGHISGVDLIRTRLQVVDFQANLIQAEQDRAAALTDLRLLLALPATTTLDLPTELTFEAVTPDENQLQHLALERRPDLRVKRLTLAQQEAELKLARASRYPDPIFGPGFSIQGPRGPDNPQQFTAILSVPLFIFNRNQGGVAQAEVAVRAAQTDLQKAILQVQNEVHVVSRTLLQNRRFVELYQAGVLEDAKSSLTIIETAYQRGGVTILDLLDAARTAAATQLNYVDALTAYQRNRFQLESVVAGDLPHETAPVPSPLTPPLRLTVNEAVSLFLKQNLDLLIAQYQIDTAKAQAITARLFPNPTLNLGTYSSWSHVTGSIARSTELWGNVTQLFELAGKRGYRLASAGFGRQSAEAALEDTIRQLTFAVKDAYVHVQSARQHVRIAQENVDRFTRIIEINAIRVQKGFLAPVDLIRLRLQVVDFQTTLLKAQQDLQSALNDLRLLLALPPAVRLELQSDLAFRRVEPDLPTLQHIARERRPDLRMARATMSQREADLQLALAGRYPDPSFGTGLAVQGPTGPDNPQQITTTSAVPLLLFNRNQGGIVQAEVMVRRSAADLKKTELQVDNEVALTYQTLLYNRGLVELYQGGVLDDARSTLAIIEKAYQRGGATILDLLDAARTDRAIQLNYVDALAAYQRNTVQLESAIGQDLPVTMEPTPAPVPTTLPLTLDQALSLFLKHNLDLLIAQYGIETAKGQQIAARLLPNPTLNLGTYSSWSHVTGSFARSTELWGNITQLFELAGKRGYRMASAAFGTQSAEAAFEDAVRQLSFAVRDAYVQAQGARNHVRIEQENVERFTRILEVNRIRLNKGFIAEVDLIRLRLQAVDFQTILLQAQQDLASALNDLHLLLALPASTNLELQTEVTFHPVTPDLSTVQQLAQQARPDIRMKRLTLSQREQDLNLARAYRYPDPSFGPGFTIQGPRGPDNPQQFTLVFSVPLLFFNRNQGGIVQAEVATRTAEADVRKTVLQTENEVEVAYRTLLHRRRLVDVYQGGVLDDARSTLTITESAYQRGGLTILDLLEAARTSAGIQLDYVDALTGYQRAGYQLEKAVNRDVLP